MTEEEFDRARPGQFRGVSVVGRASVGEESVRGFVGEDFNFGASRLQTLLKCLQLFRRNLCIDLRIMPLDRGFDFVGDVQRVCFAVGERRCAQVSVERHHRAYLFRSRGEHQSAAAARTKARNANFPSLDEVLRFQVSDRRLKILKNSFVGYLLGEDLSLFRLRHRVFLERVNIRG
jgi:hypothetical protein